MTVRNFRLSDSTVGNGLFRVGSGRGRDIIHLDMDSYFASIEQRDVPFYKGKPLLVCHTDDPASVRGVVSSASYEARAYGIKSGMSVMEAKKYCPRGVYVRGNYDKYLYNSRKIKKICECYSSRVEVFSVDEMFLDVTKTKTFFGTSFDIARNIQRDIKDKLNLSASLGVGPNKLVAKMASEFEKPAGISVVTPDDLPQIFAPLPVDDLVGVGRRMKRNLGSWGIVTIGDLAKFPEEVLRKRFGVVGTYLHHASLGQDTSRVSGDRNGLAIRSFGHSSALGKGVSDFDKLSRILLGLCEGVTRRMRKKGYTGRTINLRLSLARLFGFSRSRSLGDYTDQTNRVYVTAKDILFKEREVLKKYPATCIGISVSNLKEEEEGVQISIFDAMYPKERSLIRAVDAIKDKYGERTIVRGTLLKWERKYHAVPRIELASRPKWRSSV